MTLLKPNIERNRKRQLHGSPSVQFLNPELTDGEAWVIDFETHSTLAKYDPVDFVKITNNSSADLTFYKNGTHSEERVKDGIINTIEDENMYSIRTVNDSGGTLTAGTIAIVAQKKRIDANEAAFINASENPATKLLKGIVPFVFR